ncbi:MAG TPA: class I SAM-dependent methyltransferase [Luteolibacter sp.]
MYLSLEAELHDVFWDAEGPPAELPWMKAFLQRHPGRALDVGCGSGRLLFPLLEAGFDVEGLELSPDMLALARKTANERGLNAVLHEGDMTTFAAEPYGALLVPAFTLQLAPDPMAALKNFRRLLLPGGGLYLTVFRPDAELGGDLPEGEWYPDFDCSLPDGNRAILETQHRLDRANRLLHRAHRHAILARSGEVLREHISQQTVRWFTPRELQKLLAQAGFGHVEAIGEFEEPWRFPDGRDAPQILTVTCR